MINNGLKGYASICLFTTHIPKFSPIALGQYNDTISEY